MTTDYFEYFAQQRQQEAAKTANLIQPAVADPEDIHDMGVIDHGSYVQMDEGLNNAVIWAAITGDHDLIDSHEGYYGDDVYLGHFNFHENFAVEGFSALQVWNTEATFIAVIRRLRDGALFGFEYTTPLGDDRTWEPRTNSGDHESYLWKPVLTRQAPSYTLAP